MGVAPRADRLARVTTLGSLKASSAQGRSDALNRQGFDQTIGGRDSDGWFLPTNLLCYSDHAMVGSHFPGTMMASFSPGHGGMVIATAVSGSASKERNWK